MTGKERHQDPSAQRTGFLARLPEAAFFRWLRRSIWFLLAPLCYAVQLAIDVPYSFWFAHHAPKRSDFLAIYTGAEVFHRMPHLLYSFAAQAAEQNSILPGVGTIKPFVDPPLAAVVSEPFTTFPLAAAIIAWMAVSIVLVAVSGWILFALTPSWPWYRRVVFALCLLGYASIENFQLGQWGALELASFCAGLLLLQRRHPLAAGAAMSVILIKPQVGFLLLPVLLIGKQWRIALGFALGCALWAVTSVALVGTTGIAAWFRLVGGAFVGQYKTGIGLPSILAALGAPHAAAYAAAVLSLAVLGLCWWKREALATPLAALSIGIIASLACAPYVRSWDCVLVALPLLTLAYADEAVAITAVILFGIACLIPFAPGVVLAASLPTALVAFGRFGAPDILGQRRPSVTI